MFTKYRKRLMVKLAVFLSAVYFTAFIGTSLAHYRSNIVIKAFVPALTGGTFTDDLNEPSISIVIPPGSLSMDAKLVVKRIRYAERTGKNQTAASPAFKIRLKKASRRWGWGSKRLKLTQPMKLEIRADRAPVHPQLGEIAVRRHGEWHRMAANFYRPSDATVVTLTKRTRGQFRVVHRKLQAKAGPAVERGRDLYFNETWGDEAFWGDRFQLHAVLNNVTPFDAVGIGAQVDLTKVPQPIVDVLLSDDFDAKLAALDDPALTRALIKADAVVGVRGFFDDPQNSDRLTSVGLTCALCHVTVTQTPFQLEEGADPVPLPIGLPILGPPNTKLDAGLLLSLTPLVQTGSENTHIDQYSGWGPGRFDPRFLPDNPFDDGVFNPSSIPPLWNFVDLAEQGYAITWIGILQLRPDNNSLASGPECGIDLPLGTNGAWGTENAAIQDIEIANPLPQEFIDRLNLAEQTEPGNDIYRQDLLDIQAFLQSIVSPPPGDFDEVKAEAGLALFYGKANCVACHETAEGTGDRGFFTNIVENPPQGLLSLGIKIPGLRGLAHTAPYFHDGSAQTLGNVVERYTSPDIPEVPSDLSGDEKNDLVEYLKSL